MALSPEIQVDIEINEDEGKETLRRVWQHSLSPTIWLPRAAGIERDAIAINHTSARGEVYQRTYQQFADAARGLGYFLSAHSFRRVGVLLPNTPAFLTSIFAIPAAGGVSVAVNYRLHSLDIDYILAHADVDCVIVDREFVRLLDFFRQLHPHVLILEDADAGTAESSPFDKAIEEGWTYDQTLGSRGWDGLLIDVEDENEVIALAYTSGTTARPKGVQLTHRGAYLAALANIVDGGFNSALPGTDRCHYLWTLPMFHATGWTGPWAITAVRGTHYCLRRIDYKHIWHLLQTERISHYSAAPTVNTLLCAEASASRLDQSVRVMVAGSPPTAHLFERMESLNLRPVHVYGMSETYGPITTNYELPAWRDLPVAERCDRMARQGHGFLTSLPVRVIKPSEDGRIVNVAHDGVTIGEICFEGNICTKGYYKDPQATEKLFRGGVLHSGDLAVQHSDGSVQILDREKDVIISGGENISSVALESVLTTHPDILEVACVAVKDDIYGEVPKAYVTLRRKLEEEKDKMIIGAAILEWARSKASGSRFMMPKIIEVVSELPKTSTGKVRKNLLRDWAVARQEDVQTS